MMTPEIRLILQNQLAILMSAKVTHIVINPFSRNAQWREVNDLLDRQIRETDRMLKMHESDVKETVK